MFGHLSHFRSLLCNARLQRSPQPSFPSEEIELQQANVAVVIHVHALTQSGVAPQLLHQLCLRRAPSS